MNIHYNEETKNNININSIDSEFNNEILLTTLKNISHDTYLIEVEKTGSSSSTPNNEDTLHINYMYYLNEKTIAVHKKAINVNANGINPQTGWTNDNGKLYTETKDSEITMNSVQFSQFWISGDVDPNYGAIDIYIDDVFLSNVSLYNEKHEDNIVFYESPMFKRIDKHKITIKNHDNRGVSIYQIHYNPYSDYEKESDELDGLINVTCDRLNYESGYAYCHRSKDIFAGSSISSRQSIYNCFWL